MLRKNKLTKISYTKIVRDKKVPTLITEQEHTVRMVVPTSIPENIKALDVSELSTEEQEQIAKFSDEYAKYIKNHMKRAFSFEDWLSHSKNYTFVPKWRTFKPDQTTVIV